MAAPVGVCNNPDPVSSVVGIDGRSRNNERPCGVVHTFQVRKHFVEAHADVPSNILSKHPSGPAFVHEPSHFRPEVTVIFLAPSLPGHTKGLAWVSSADEVHRPNCVGSELSDVLMDRGVGPVFGKHSSAIGVNLAEGDGVHSRSFETKAKSSYPTE